MTLKDINAELSITNVQQSGTEETVLTQECPCGFCVKDTKIYIAYQEQEENMAADVRSLIKIDNGSVSIKRTGTFCTTMRYEEGRHDVFSYTMPYGTLQMEVDTEQVKYDFNHSGGRLYLKYRLKVNGEETLNCLTVEVRNIMR